MPEIAVTILLGTIFVLQNCPIRVEYLLNTVFKYEYTIYDRKAMINLDLKHI